ncbi:phosphotransferase family protein [Brevundimonas staleyi]|uniref:Phosphotransferase family protein n=1 Tax=Brevundimonas staleyi TaxID=74326 RepID=A0ABW0FRF8_9CAUL
MANLQIDAGALAAYLKTAAPEWSGVTDVFQMKGGQSNPTYRVDTDRGPVVLRMRPVGAPLWAHNIAREYKVLAALGPTDVPVPEVYHYCTDESVLGGEFYLMEFIEGRIEDDCRLPGYSPEERTAIYRSYVQAYARLHAVDWAAAGLSDFGKHDTYAARQLHLHGKAFAGYCPEGMPNLDWLHAELTKRVPPQAKTGLVHGDVRMGNVVLHPTEPRVIALLDWEMSTLGDVYADAAILTVPYFMPDNPQGYLGDTDFEASGIPDLDTLIAWYCEDAGIMEIPNLDFMILFNLYRYAAVNYGVGYRAEHGMSVSDDGHLFGLTALPISKRARAMAEESIAAGRL